MKKLPFCIECGERTAFVVATTQEKIERDGIHFTFPKKQAFCAKCREPIYVPEINDANYYAWHDAWQKAKEGANAES